MPAENHSTLKNLKRYPHRKREPLQAWDSADELLLEHVATLSLEGKRLLIVNDSFGGKTTTPRSDNL